MAAVAVGSHITSYAPRHGTRHPARPPRRAALHMAGPARPGTGTDRRPDTEHPVTQNTPKCRVGFGWVGAWEGLSPGLAARQIQTNSICDCKSTFPAFLRLKFARQKKFFFLPKKFQQRNCRKQRKNVWAFFPAAPHLSPRQAGPGEPEVPGRPGGAGAASSQTLFFTSSSSSSSSSSV